MTPESQDSARKRRHRKERIAAAFLVLVVIAIAVASFVLDKRAREELREDLTFIPAVSKITPEIELLQEFVRIDTSTPAGAAAGARWLVSQLARRGVRAEIIASAPDRLNVYARIKGRNPGNGLLLFNHIDVVPPEGGWSTPPFSANIALNMMWGRGTLDMKAMTVCQLEAFTEVARSGEPPQHDLVFLATADEETGSHFGMQWLLEHRPDVFAGIQYGVTEGGITEMMSERMTYFGIEVAGKQDVDLTVEGPDLDTLREVRIALEPSMHSRDPHRVLPIVRQFFRDIAPTRIAYGPYLADIDETIRQGNFWSLPTPYRDLTQDTLWAGDPTNISGRWQMNVKMLNLPDTNPDERLEWLGNVLAPYGVRIVQVREKQGPVPVSRTDNPLFSLMVRRAEEHYGVPAGVEVIYRSKTDSRFLRRQGIECYGLCPYPVDFYQSNTIHGVDERIRIDSFMMGVAYMKDVAREWARTAQ